MDRNEREKVIRTFMSRVAAGSFIEETLTGFLSEMMDRDFLTDQALIEAFLKFCLDHC